MAIVTTTAAGCHSSADHRSSAAGRCSSAADHRSSAAGHRSSAAGYRSSTAPHFSTAIRCLLTRGNLPVRNLGHFLD